MAKKCPKCGTIVDDNAKFCDECGEMLEIFQNDTSSQTINMYSNEGEQTPRQPIINMYSTDTNTNQPISAPVSIGKSALSIIALISGILSIVTLGCWFIPEIVAIVCGALAKNEVGKRTKLGNAGFICGIIGCVMLLIVIIFGVFL